MKIKTGFGAIRDWTNGDIPSIVKYADNAKIARNLRDAFPHPYAAADAERFLDMVKNREPRTVFAVDIDGEAVGSIGLVPGADVHRYTAEMGYWLGEPFWGRGIMTEAVRVLVSLAFSEMNFIRVFAEPYATNPASARVLENAGFHCEGKMRSSAFKEGKVIDQLLYSCIRDDI